MGWWPFGDGNSIKAKKLPDAQQSQADSKGGDQQLGAFSSDSSAVTLLPPIPKPGMVFEFGRQVSSGAPYMRGMCAGDDPNRIQACAWSIEQHAAKGTRPAYRIEF